MHMWVISVGRYLSRLFRKTPCPGQGSNPGPIDLKASTLPSRYKSRHIPNIYTETDIKIENK